MNSKTTQGGPAVGFLVVAFTEEKAAEQALKEMKKGKKAKTFYFEEAAVIRQDAAGKVHYKETGDLKTGEGGGIGALVGGVMGALGGPGGVALGASAGAAIGAAVAHKDDGFRDESLKTVGMALKPGTSAVVAISSHDFLRSVQKQVSVEDIRQFVANLSREISNKLNQGKSLALGILLAEDGLAFEEVAVDENSADVIVLAITKDAALTMAATITPAELGDQAAGAMPTEAEVKTSPSETEPKARPDEA